MKIRITESQLKRLINEQDNNYLSRVEKIDTSILDLIDRINDSDFYPENTILGQTGKIIRWVPEPKTKRRGQFHIFDIKPENGIPFIREIGGITYRGQLSDINDIKIGSQLFIDGKVPSVDSYGETTLEQMNNVWSVNGNKSQQVLNIAVQLVKKNSEIFKKEFERVTRNQWAIKTLWGDNPIKKEESQYNKFFVSKLNPFIKKFVIDKIQDTELVKHLTFKVKNFNSEDKYPNITPPVPQPVKPGSGYPLA